jgi:nitrite reductase/ring-hydroxylating ferredoxin subunit
VSGAGDAVAGGRTLCRVAELEATGCRQFTLGRGEWPLRCFAVKSDAGIRAFVNRCAHMRLPLNYIPDSFLNYDNSLIQCYVHGALFAKENGYCMAGPCSGASLAAVPIRVVGDAVLLAEGVDENEFAARYE